MGVLFVCQILYQISYVIECSVLDEEKVTGHLYVPSAYGFDSSHRHRGRTTFSTQSSENKITTHLYSIERADWSKPHDMFKARGQTTSTYGQLPVRGLAECLLFIDISLRCFTRIEIIYVINAKDDLLFCQFVFIALENPHSCGRASALTPAQLERINRPARHVKYNTTMTRIEQSPNFKSAAHQKCVSGVLWKVCV